jgi:hypothetical protein
VPRPVRLAAVPAGERGCDCPACSGDWNPEDWNPEELLRELVDSASELIDCTDPIEVELIGSAFHALGADLEDPGEFDDAVCAALVPALREAGTAETVALLTAIGSVGSDRVRAATRAAAEDLVAGGVARPAWAAVLAEPVTVDECWLFPAGPGAALYAVVFRRAGHRHGLVGIVMDMGAPVLVEAYPVPEDALDDVLSGLRSDLPVPPGTPGARQVTASEARAALEDALLARDELGFDSADFDSAGMGIGDDASDPDGRTPEDETSDDEIPDFEDFRALLLARLAVMPAPPGNRRRDPVGPGLPGPALLAGNLAGDGVDLVGRRAGVALPPKRTRADGPAPVMRIKVGLRGAKPPIWRRLEVPATVSLARLHEVLQVAFGWEGYHMHVFDTPYGRFGRPDPQLGHRSEKPVTLEQVAGREGDRIGYTYDFGDDWDCDIRVEKLVEAVPGHSYPRCTGGRRAAPPEDCGGIWGYEYLCEILADPDHDEHADRLEWLGLASAAEFDPAAFDPDTINQALAAHH